MTGSERRAVKVTRLTEAVFTGQQSGAPHQKLIATNK
jgi:hypothetical protein